MRFLRVLLTTIVLLTTACQPALLSGSTGPNRVQITTNVSQRPILRGQVVMPKGFDLQHTTADILGNATVSVSDAGGVVRMAGTTDATGAFALYRPTTAFTLADGAMYQLEILKRLPSATTDLPVMSLKTWLKRVGTGWQSMAMNGDAVVVNLQTTALSYFVAEGTANATDLMGALTGPNLDTLNSTLAAIPGAIDGMNRRLTSMTSLLQLGKDPVGTRNFNRDADAMLADANGVAEASYIVSVNGNLVIESSTLTMVSLPMLANVASKLEIRNCPNLTSVDLPALTSVGDGLSIQNCPLMTRLPSIPALTTLNHGSDTYLSLENLPGLTSLAGLEHVQAIAKLQITNCPGITDLTGLNSLTTASLQFRDNPNLTSLAGMPALQTLTDLQLSNSPHLASLAGLEAITNTNEIYLENCGIQDLTGLSGLTTISGRIRLYSLPQLINLHGLSALSSVTEDLSASNCTQLTSIADLSALRSLNGMQLSFCPSLTSLTGLEALQRIGSVNLSNTGVTSLVPLHHLNGSGAATGVRSMMFSSNPNLTQGCINALQAALPAFSISGFGNNPSMTCP